MPKTKLKNKPEKRSSGMLIPLIFLSTVLLAVLVEIPTHYVEKLAGSYLNWRNADREAWGTLWEKELVSREASRQLEAETADATKLKREAELVENLADLVALIPEGGGIPLTPDKLVELYQKIPQPMQHWLFTPQDLTRYYLNSRWTRSAVWRKNGVGTVYLIDDRNRIIEDFQIEEPFLKAVNDYGKVHRQELANLPGFAGRIYPAGKFFEHYFSLSELEQGELLGNDNVLLTLPKDINQVGFVTANDPSDYGRIGFENITRGGFVTTIYPVPAGIIDDFLWRLAWSEETEISPAVQFPSEQSSQFKRGGVQ